MRRLVQAARAGEWPAAQATGSVTLSYDDRHRRRMRLATDQGEAVLLDLTRPFPLTAGDGLALENEGGWLEVRAAAEDVIEVEGTSPGHLASLAWHLGNRHMPVVILEGGRLRVRYDRVLEDLLARLGGVCARTRAPFQPDSSAAAGPRQER